MELRLRKQIQPQNLFRFFDDQMRYGGTIRVCRGHSADMLTRFGRFCRLLGGQETRSLMPAAKRQRILPQPQLNWILPPSNFHTGAPRFGSNDTILSRQLVIDANVELLPLWDFASTCNSHGLNTPMPSVIDINIERNWLHLASFPLIADEIFWFSDIPGD